MILDIIVTRITCNISVLSPPESGLFTDHGTIVFSVKTAKKAAPPLTRTVFDYRRADFEGLRAALEAIDLTSTIHKDVVNTSWLEWKDTFLAAVQDFIPTKKNKGRNSPPWIDGEIIHALRKKDAIRQKIKKTPTDALRSKFKELRAKVKRLVAESRENFYNSLDADLRSNPKRFWSVFKLNNKESSLPESVSVGSTAGQTSPARSAEVFNDYFASVFSDGGDLELTTPTVDHSVSCDSYLCDVELTIQEVQESLLALDTTKATGPDGIPCRLLKETARQIAPLLTQLYNLSLLQGVLPKTIVRFPCCR